METLESLKRQIRTAEDLHGLVRTMKALAAVNIRQLERAVESLADYARTIELSLRIVLRQQGPEAVAARAAPRRRVGAVVFGSDQGICGPLNDQIVAFARKRLDEDSVSLETGRCWRLESGRPFDWRTRASRWAASSPRPVLPAESPRWFKTCC